MPNYGYLPSRQEQLESWSASFSAKITAEPGAFGLSEGQAAPYAGIQAAFADALAVSQDPTTRSPANIEKKNTAKKTLIAETRKLVDVIQAWPAMTNDKRAELGITVRDNVQTPAPVPASAPEVTVASVSGRLLNLELRQAGSERRGKPTGVKAAWLFYFVGEDQPTDFAQMSFYGSTTKTDTQIVMPQTITAGTKVWVGACWINTTQKPGPVSLPVATWTTHGTMQAAA